MASRYSKANKSVSFEDFERDVARRVAAAGDPVLPRNSGKRRTESKQALLKAIAKTGKRW